MKDFCPYITNDGSVGLYSKEFNDIYHSTFGAYAEACEKFVLPADIDFYMQNFSEINVLDICYGIGYNSKSFLNFFFEKFFKKNVNVNRHNDTIYSDNIFGRKIYIKAVDTDKELIFLSPFFTCNAKHKPENQNLPTEKVEHLCTGKIEKQYDYDNFINYLLIEKLAENFPDFLNSDFLELYLREKDKSLFFDNAGVKYYRFLQKKRMSGASVRSLNALLHNIYYLNISSRYKKAQKALKNGVFEIDYKVEDARSAILADDKIYQLVFLDAFTPEKCPCLWSVDFFKLLHKHLDENGRILTYSNSARIRNAFSAAGFYVGKIYNERAGNFTGTIAVKNKSFIKYPLSDYDLRLMKTRAGIFYRDENLNTLNEAIIARNKFEVENSPLMSSSKFIKEYRKEHQNV